MTDKIKYLIILLFGGLISYIFGIFSGKSKQKEKQEKETIKNVKKSININNTPTSKLDSMQDKYE